MLQNVIWLAIVAVRTSSQHMYSSRSQLRFSFSGFKGTVGPRWGTQHAAFSSCPPLAKGGRFPTSSVMKDIRIFANLMFPHSDQAHLAFLLYYYWLSSSRYSSSIFFFRYHQFSGGVFGREAAAAAADTEYVTRKPMVSEKKKSVKISHHFKNSKFGKLSRCFRQILCKFQWTM